MAETRSPICVAMGHVDHGKSSILDQIRGTAIVNTEAGKITQHVGCSIVPLKIVKKVCGELLSSLGMKFTIPGLLFLDTPGHAAFTNLRKRGGNLSDIAILVVDINEGFKPQTIEAVEILKSYKTPFVIAANKVDLISGWQNKDDNLLKSISMQSENVQKMIETKLYELVGKLHEVSELQAERFDRVSDFTKQVAIIPTSAETAEGMPELLMVLTGLAQKYFEESLKLNVKGDAKGVVLEVKEDKGLGVTIDVIIYDGTLEVNDTLVIGGVNEAIVTKVRALFEPNPLQEMRDRKAKFNSVKKVVAAVGVKISAPNVKEVLAGMPVRSCNKSNVDKVKEEVQKEVDEVLVQTDSEGLVIKSDTLGSLEALSKMLREKGVKIKKAAVGNISKKDIIDAEANYEKDPLSSVVLGFHVKNESMSSNDLVHVMTDNVIYKLIEDFEKWQEENRKKMELAEMGKGCSVVKIHLMPNYVFRQSNPAIIGVEVLKGKLCVGQELMNEKGVVVTKVKEIQLDKKNVTEVVSGKQVAASLEKVTVGRQINEGDILFSSVTEVNFRKMKDLKQHLTLEEKDVLREIAEIHRVDNVLWGV